MLKRQPTILKRAAIFAKRVADILKNCISPFSIRVANITLKSPSPFTIRAANTTQKELLPLLKGGLTLLKKRAAVMTSNDYRIVNSVGHGLPAGISY